MKHHQPVGHPSTGLGWATKASQAFCCGYWWLLSQRYMCPLGAPILAQPAIKTLMSWGGTEVVHSPHAHQQRPVTSQLVNAGQLLLLIFLQTAGRQLWPFPLCSAQTNALPHKHFHSTGRKKCIFLKGHTNLIRACYLQKTPQWPKQQSRVHWKWQWPLPGDTEGWCSRTAAGWQGSGCQDHATPLTADLTPACPGLFSCYWIAKTFRNREGRCKHLFFQRPDFTWKENKTKHKEIQLETPKRIRSQTI